MTELKSFHLHAFRRGLSWFFKSLFVAQRLLKPTKLIIPGFRDFVVCGKARIEGQGCIKIEAKTILGQFEMKRGEIYIEPREPGAIIEFGRACAIMNGCEFVARERITVGVNCLFGPNVSVYDSDFHDIDPLKRSLPGKTFPVVIENDVWIGAGATILKGVTVGRGAVIAAGSTVTRDVPSLCVVMGNPAREVRKLTVEAPQSGIT